MKAGRIGVLAKFVVAALPCAVFAQSVPPSPGEVIARAIAARNAQNAKGWKYTYREDHEETQIDKGGKPGRTTTKTYEHIMLEGENYSKLILIDGKPLDAKTQKKADQDLEKDRAQRRRNGFLSLHRTVSLGGLELLDRLFDNKVTGEETILGRRTWRMESEPKAGHAAANKQEAEAMASRRVGWFDEDDGFRIRERSEFIRATSGFQPGSVFDMEYVRVGGEWLPGIATIVADMKMMPGVRGRVESHQRYSDYKRFTVDSLLTPE